jgi:copper chaperone NosL
MNVDNCQHCKMTITDLKFSTELITDKGRINKFDDIKCMLAYSKENALNKAQFFVADYYHPEKFVKAENAVYVSGGKISSPMNGNIAAFSTKEDAEKFAAEKEATLTTWKEVSK